MIDLNIISKFIELAGELLIAFSVVRVHTHIRNEHRLDQDVYRMIKKEHRLVIIAVTMLIVGFILQFFA